jgi:hypothetical protein
MEIALSNLISYTNYDKVGQKMIFDVKIHGKNYAFKDEFNNINAIGFFVYIFIQADSRERAEVLAINNLRKDNLYIDNIKPAETSISELIAEEINIASYFDFIPNKLSEFILYQTDD